MNAKLLVFTLIGATSALAAEPVAGPLQAAADAAKKGDFAAATKLLQGEADRGNADAQNALGEFALSGRGGKASATEAAKWFQKAADASQPQAMFNLAALLSSGAPGVEKDLDKARFLFRASAEAGHPGAQTAVGAAAEREGDGAEARKWYEKAAAQQQPEALLALARLTDQAGEAAPASELYFQAARAGSVVAMNEIGSALPEGCGFTTGSGRGHWLVYGRRATRAGGGAGKSGQLLRDRGGRVAGL